jgi:G3E family GTPase
MATRIVIIGGFLGAGKTTLINKLGKELAAKGKRVGLITNDQGEELVDTQYSKEMGMEVAEVLRGCFCCHFNDLLHSARVLAQGRPDIILAEPVGSCTDLLATVIAPMKAIYPNEFNVAPLFILVDSSRLADENVDPETLSGYLRQHQIQEGEYVVLTKTDRLRPERLQEVRKAIASLNPTAKIIEYSALSGKNMDKILEVILSADVSHRHPVDIDYDKYAEAEAELGWYNGTVVFQAEHADAYDICLTTLKGIAEAYDAGDIAHAKVMLRSPSSVAKMSLVQGQISVDLVKGSRYADGESVLNINARIVSAPEALRENVRKSADVALRIRGLRHSAFKDDCFSPSRPNPTHRMVE